MDYKDYGALAMDHSGYISNIYDAQTHEILYMSQASMDLYGLKQPKDFQGRKCYQVTQGLDSPCPFCPIGNLAEGESYRWERYSEQFGRWFDSTDLLLRLDGRLCCLEIARDITVRKDEDTLHAKQFTMEDVLFRCLQTLTQEKNLNIAVNLFLEAICGYYHADRSYIFEYDLENQTANNTFEWCSPGAASCLDEMQALPISYFADCNRKFETEGEFSEPLLPGETVQHDELHRITKRQGIESWIAAPLLHSGQVVGFVGVDDPKRNAGNLTLLRSVADFVLEELEKRRLVVELEKMSYTDLLTGLQNRNRYNRDLRQYQIKTPEMLGIVTLDINRLKEINEKFGLEHGDKIIQRIAEILQEHFSEGVYRIGSDEFTVLCSDLPKDLFKEKVVALRRVFDLAQNFSVSMGFAWKFDEDMLDVNALLQQADEMRDAEKQAYYHSMLNEGRPISRTGFAGEVLRELEENRFVVYYQPQVNIQTGVVIGAEALVRKLADDGSIIPPGNFIPFYEVGGVISHIDLFVLRTACAALRTWHSQGHDLHISVNFSRVTLLEPNIVDVLKKICQEESISPESITVEVTERIGEMDPERLKELVRQLKAAGFSISLDDFGSQYSNLAILAAMDFDEVKFDRALVSTLEENEKSRMVMESSLGLCRSLKGTSSLAEGIETKGQLELLAEYRCDYGQGYYFSRPIPHHEFDEYLKKHSPEFTEGNGTV